jgi:hypothetical protein
MSKPSPVIDTFLLAILAANLALSSCSRHIRQAEVRDKFGKQTTRSRAARIDPGPRSLHT